MFSLRDNWRQQRFTCEVRTIKCCGIQVGIQSKKIRMILQTSGNRNQRNSMKAKMRKHIKRLCVDLPANMMKETKFQMQLNLLQLNTSIHE